MKRDLKTSRIRPSHWPGKLFATVSLLGMATNTCWSQAPPTKTISVVTIRLVNVTIPPDSPLRLSSAISKPPSLYVELHENGTLIGTSSVAGTSWQPDYPDTKENRWIVKTDAKSRYLIKVWDSNWGPDDLAFDIAGTKGHELKGVLYERGTASEAKDRLASVEFELVEAGASAGQAPPAKP